MSKSLYKNLYEQIKQDILNGTYKTGEQIPSELDLASEYGVSRITSKKALEMLAAEGIVERHVGRGTFVKNQTTINQNLSSQKVIGLVMVSMTEHYGTEIVAAIEAFAAGKCMVVLRLTYGIPEKEDEAIKELMEFGVDGLIVFPAKSEYISERILQLVISQFPIVVVDRTINGINMASVRTDNSRAVQAGLEYLTFLGHKHIAILSPPLQSNNVLEERSKAVIQFSADRGIFFQRKHWLTSIHGDSGIPEEEAEKILRHLRQYPEISAIFAFEYPIALLAAEAIKRQSKHLAEDIDLICFDSPPTMFGQPPFTHLRQNEKALGETALATLLNLMNQEEAENKISIRAELIVGQSTRGKKVD
ncbi:GntR family transcriptional regulator [Bacillus gobiensis]|uniref:GntR family transcriptional regulator n=1 Tax=Bacillus gobiensis TaxID=1441095 RepID=UPI003D1FB9D9